MKYKLIIDDCINAMSKLKDNVIDAIVTDPPYGISFMSLEWDYDVPTIEVWEECLRVLKPGGFLLSFAGTRTQHRMACNIEDAGFEIRDMIAWIYSNGLPKGIDIGLHHEQWKGWNTGLKPALEPITVARKPFKGNTISNMIKYGTGGINVDECRIGTDGGTEHIKGKKQRHNNIYGHGLGKDFGIPVPGLGRYPANVIHDGIIDKPYFYCAKASTSERAEGVTGKKGIPTTNPHPCVKPYKLMSYLVRLVTPKDGVVLDPFVGSGSTGIGCVIENFNFIGIDNKKEYIDIAEQRLNHHYSVHKYHQKSLW